MKFLFIHALKGFSLAEWNLRHAVGVVAVQWKSCELTCDSMENNERFRRMLVSWRPDVVGFSCHFWSIDLFLEAARWIRLYLPDAVTVFGGPQVNSESYAHHLLSSFTQVDYVVRGAGELPLAHFVDQWPEQVVEDIPGFSFRMDSSIFHNQVWDNLFWTRDPIFCPENRMLTRELEGLQVVSYETIRGCINQCSYCQYSNMSLGLLDDQLVMQELAYLCSFRIPHLRICDSHFGGVKARAKRLLSTLGKVNISSSIKVYPHLSHVDREYVSLAREAHAEITSIGIQTTNSRSLATIKRHAVQEKHLDAIRLILEYFPETPADLITGMPGDDLDGVRTSFRRVIDLGFRSVNVFRLAAFPGTEVYENPAIWQGCIRPVLSRSGEVLESSDFPAATTRNIAHLIHVLGIVLIFQETQQTVTKPAHLMDLLEAFDETELFELHDTLYSKSPGYLYTEFESMLRRFSRIGNQSSQLFDALARDMAFWLFKRCLQQDVASLATDKQGASCRVSRVILECISGRVVEIDLKRKQITDIVSFWTNKTEDEDAMVLRVSSICPGDYPQINR